MSWRAKARIGRILGGVTIALILIYMMLPSVIVAAAAFSDGETLAFPPQGFSLRWFVRAFTYPDFQTGLINSLIIAAVTSVVATVAGAGYAFVVDRYRFVGRQLLRGMLTAPLVIPHFIVGLALLMLASLVGLNRSYTIVVLTHVIVVTPFVARSVHASLQALDVSVERAAAGLGASPLTVFLRIDVPLLAPGLLGGFLFAVILSFTEFSASLFVTGQQTQTLPVAMFTYIRDFADPTMAALSTVFIVVVACLLTIATRWFGLAAILSDQNEH
ncbi:ABC transporter permease [Ancylobacter mangrovi]|uniref:ABC transporter permease n=1 Tax=Ancylobacter mangrovi TaxID=2972472 RepID=UPI002161104B|nr:ABC transporter permease [Ancylobacter mangrovi]MCS0504887.1 ABC transporter permease [Ancylobacter mangrovi]